jgi:hypothetical protein
MRQRDPSYIRDLFSEVRRTFDRAGTRQADALHGDPFNDRVRENKGMTGPRFVLTTPANIGEWVIWVFRERVRYMTADPQTRQQRIDDALRRGSDDLPLDGGRWQRRSILRTLNNALKQRDRAAGLENFARELRIPGNELSE